MSSLLPPTLDQWKLLEALSDCERGRGVLVTHPGEHLVAVLRSCEMRGWAEEVSSGPLRVWKITDAGRDCLDTTFSHESYAEC